MAPLKLAVAVLALVASAPAHADPLARWQSYIAEASARFGVPAAWIEGVIRAESAGQTLFQGRPITSRTGAMGLMQLMPGTWAQMRAALRLGRDPHDPRDNILAGTAYLRLMYDRFGYPGLFAAYNAGPARYAAFVAKQRTLPEEARIYLASVAGEQKPLPGPMEKMPTNEIFFTLRLEPSIATTDRTGSASFFVQLGMAAVSSPP